MSRAKVIFHITPFLARFKGFGFALALAVIALGQSAMPIYAVPEPSVDASSKQANASPVGSWELSLTFPGNPTAFSTVFTFAPGGSFSAIVNDTPPSSATSAVGTWGRTGPQSFEVSFVRYLFNPPLPAPLNQAAILRGYETFTLGGSQAQFSGIAVLKFFDSAGNLLAVITSQTTGSRLTASSGGTP
jgi:hypothetical protein